MSNPKDKRAALRRAINRYRDAAIAESWKGAGNPDSYAEVEDELERAEAAMVALINRYLPSVELPAEFDSRRGLPALGDHAENQKRENTLRAARLGDL